MSSSILPDNLPKKGTTLTVTTTSEDVLSKAQALELELFGDALHFEFKYPDGFEDYQGTFTLVMGYNTDSPDDVAIYYFNEENGKWEIQQGEVNQELRTISLNVTHFSNYGVMAQVEEPQVPDVEKPMEEEQGKDDESSDETPPPGAKDPSEGPKDDNKNDNKDKTKADIKVDSQEDATGNLPQTATNIYNWLLVGASLLLLGAFFFFISRNRLVKEEK